MVTADSPPQETDINDLVGPNTATLQMGFTEWTRKMARWMLGAMGVGTVASLAMGAYHLWHDLNASEGWIQQNYGAAVSLVQAVTIWVVLAVAPSHQLGVSNGAIATHLKAASKDPGSDVLKVAPFPSGDALAVGIDAAERSLWQFESWWTLLWVSWGLRYSFACASEFFRPPLGPLHVSESIYAARDVLVVLTRLFDGLSTLSIALLYVVLAHPTVSIGGYRSGTVASSGRFWIATISAATAIEVVVGIVEPSGDLAKALTWGGALVSATALASLIGRLGVRFLNLPGWTVVCLYAYSAVQMYNPLLVGHFRGEEVVYLLSLVLKLLLYACVSWALLTGRLYYSLLHGRLLLENIDAQWREFVAAVGPGSHNKADAGA